MGPGRARGKVSGGHCSFRFLSGGFVIYLED